MQGHPPPPLLQTRILFTTLTLPAPSGHRLLLRIKELFQLRKLKLLPKSTRANPITSKSLSNIRRHAKQADPDPNAIGSQLNSRSSTRPTGMTRSKSTKPPLLHESHGNSRIRCPSSPARPPSPGHGPATKTSTPLDPNPRLSSRPPSAGHTPPTPAAPPLRIQRQTSFQRSQPPTAPPAFELPPPPKVPEEPVLENDDLDIPLDSEHSLLSSNLSFGSSSLSRESTSRETSDGDKWSFVTNLRPEYESETKRHMKPPLDIPTSPQHLRVYSHSSPNQRSPAGASPASSSEQSGVEASHKILKKQRSQHRLGLPPLSLGLKYTQATNATSVPSLPVPSTTLPTEPRGGNTSYHSSTPVVPTRKRVFSGSSLRRPSTSSDVPNSSHEDDVRSLFSLRSDHEMFTNASPLKPWPTNVSISASCWDDQPPLSPVRSDYTPQKIMSPEDQAKVEAELDDISVMSALSPAIIPLSPARSRATSMSTVFSDRDSEIIPSSIFSMPFSESRSIRSPQVSSKSLISPTSEIGETITGWSASQGKPKPVLPLSRRPSTASGVFGSGFVSPKSIIQSAASQSEVFVKMDAHAGTAAIDPPTASIFPPKIRRPQRKSSDASNKPLAEQVRSLPPPPRPRAKAEVVINTQVQPYSHVDPSPEIGVESSIGVDFGHHRCPGLVESPSIQSMNSTLSMRTVSSQTKGLRTSHVPTIPPRAPTRSGSSNSRRVRIAAPQPPPVTMNNSAKLSRRISLQRKPSFLDISDDDDDDETSEENLDFGSIMWISKAPSGDAASFSRGTYSTTSAAESFLEFGRDSFDTASDH